MNKLSEMPADYAGTAAELAARFPETFGPPGTVRKSDRGTDDRPLTGKDTNPKDAVGTAKAPFSTVSAPVIAEIGLAMLEGARKYGRHNYRIAGVRASVYYDAAFRHLAAWWEGEDLDPDSGLSHITKALATLTVLRDSQIVGNWKDDRPPAVLGWPVRMNAKAAAIIDRLPDAKPAYTELEHGEIDPLVDAITRATALEPEFRVMFEDVVKQGAGAVRVEHVNLYPDNDPGDMQYVEAAPEVHTFKVGDRVRCCVCDVLHYGYVTGIEPGVAGVSVDWIWNRDGRFVLDNQLSLTTDDIGPSPLSGWTPLIGERVIAVAYEPKGKVGKITVVDESGSLLVEFEDWNEGHGTNSSCWWIDQEHIEPLWIVEAK